MRTSAPVLETRDLTVRYGSRLAVDGVSIAAAPGEVLGLLGPNGAGKTSVIRALTTIVPVASGTATVAGHGLGDPAAVRRRIGVLPESNGYPTAQTAPGYLTYYGQLFGLPRVVAAARADELLDRMGLGGNQDPIGTFSRGMRQRLGLARALVSDPAVVFLGEPTLGLDPAGKEDILAQLGRAAAEDATCVILCSHLLDEVERVCDRVAILHAGRIVAAGTVNEVTASAGVGGRGWVRVAPDRVVAADSTLRGSGGVAATGFDHGRPGDIRLDLVPGTGAAGRILRALLDIGVEPLAFDLQGARLSDAFLALTSSAASTPTRGAIDPKERRT